MTVSGACKEASPAKVVQTEPRISCDQSPASYSDKVEDALLRNRSEDRIFAVAGAIDDARPLFGNCEHAEWAGEFMVLAMLSQDAVLTTAMRIYKSLGSAFYGLRTMIVTWVLMALLRIKCNEGLSRMLEPVVKEAVKSELHKNQCLQHRKQACRYA